MRSLLLIAVLFKSALLSWAAGGFPQGLEFQRLVALELPHHTVLLNPRLVSHIYLLRFAGALPPSDAFYAAKDLTKYGAAVLAVGPTKKDNYAALHSLFIKEKLRMLV